MLGDLGIDLTRRRGTLAGRPLRLTTIEYRLLHALSLDAGGATTYESHAPGLGRPGREQSRGRAQRHQKAPPQARQRRQKSPGISSPSEASATACPRPTIREAEHAWTKGQSATCGQVRRVFRYADPRINKQAPGYHASLKANGVPHEAHTHPGTRGNYIQS